MDSWLGMNKLGPGAKQLETNVRGDESTISWGIQGILFANPTSCTSSRPTMVVWYQYQYETFMSVLIPTLLDKRTLKKIKDKFSISFFPGASH